MKGNKIQSYAIIKRKSNVQFNDSVDVFVAATIKIAYKHPKLIEEAKKNPKNFRILLANVNFFL